VQKLAVAAALALAAAGAVFAQNAAAPSDRRPGQPVAASDPALPAGLSDLEKTTFACPRAALNAAARAVAAYPSQGTYQFSYFNIVSASHHAAYEVHFRSNYAAEPPLRFCVAIYCQQGFDPATAKTTVTLIGANAAGPATGAGHAANACSPPRRPAPRRTPK
jgi:hypothetical protein